MMKIEFKTDSGVLLDVTALAQASSYYSAACTAEFIQENYPELKFSDEEALRAGYEVRRRMDKFDCTESEILYEYIPSLYREAVERRANS